MTAGAPGKLTPATFHGQAGETTRQCSPFMIQIDGIPKPRCGSFASIGFPLAVIEPATTQSFEPTPWLPTMPWALSKPASEVTSDPVAARVARPACCSAVSNAVGVMTGAFEP